LLIWLHIGGCIQFNFFPQLLCFCFSQNNNCYLPMTLTVVDVQYHMIIIKYIVYCTVVGIYIRTVSARAYYINEQHKLDGRGIRPVRRIFERVAPDVVLFFFYKLFCLTSRRSLRRCRVWSTVPPPPTGVLDPLLGQRTRGAVGGGRGFSVAYNNNHSRRRLIVVYVHVRKSRRGVGRFTPTDRPIARARPSRLRGANI